MEITSILSLIPDCDLKQVHAAGDGARIALLYRDKRHEAQKIVNHATYVELASDNRFQDAFVEALHLPHATDTFTHIDHILPVSLHKKQYNYGKYRARPRS